MARKIKSIITDDLDHCYLCCAKRQAIHHIYGGPNRPVSEKNGFIIPLCFAHHNGSDEGVHFNKDLDLFFKRLCQLKFEKTHTRAEFMALIGRNYLE
mgnify:FL=1